MNRPPATVMVIFGAKGDLARRKLLPALYNLFLDDWMPEQFAILGISRDPKSDADYRLQVREALDSFSRSRPVDEQRWRAFASQIFYLSGDPAVAALYPEMKAWIAAWEKSKGLAANRVYYLAVPPALFEPISVHLGQAGMLADRQRDRLVVEKPFGRDLESARHLNHLLTGMLEEKQIFRIDHYLGKETVQNILALRFANSMFEPVWNRRYIDHVKITVAEKVGVEKRGAYYDSAGALRDMMQNHLLQILCHVAMEPPVTFSASEIRNKKVDVLHAVRTIQPQDVPTHAVRSQYAPGSLDGRPTVGYRQEPGISPNSRTETYAGLKLFVDNWRWQDVPFYVRTGKHLPLRISEVCIEFRPVPHQSFPASPDSPMLPNGLFLRLYPDEGIVLRLMAKQPGHRLLLSPVYMRFAYQDSFSAPARDAYETLLRDVMLGDGTLFMSADQVEAAWSIVEPVLRAWESDTQSALPTYPAGTWGPDAADRLIDRDGHCWQCSAIPNQAVEAVAGKR